jgi:hypothetical protein
MISNRNIFVSIACFLDPDIKNTIQDCLDKAVHPERIVFGICLQEDPDDKILSDYDNHPQFRIHRMHFQKAKGPTYARYFCSRLLQDERYFLQIDCHTRFVKNWDRIILKCLHECQDRRAIITNFPLSIDKLTHSKSHKLYPLNRSTRKFRSISLTSIKLGSISCQSTSPEDTYYLSAAFLFGRSAFIKRVPYDPYLTFSYQTIEQQFYAIRLYTHGWNLYMPTRHVLATNYQKTLHFDAGKSRVYAPSNKARGLLSWDRVLYYYGLKGVEELSSEVRNDLTKYGLGTNRSLHSFFEIHNQPEWKQNLRNGLSYTEGEWKKTQCTSYRCINPLLNDILNKQEGFINTPEGRCDFVWDMKIKEITHEIQHYPMKFVSFIDNKRTFFQLINPLNVGLPKTFFTLSEFTKNYKRGNNYFLKYAGKNGGKQVFVCNTVSEVEELLSQKHDAFIIQQEVPNMLLISNRKFVLRIWMTIFDNHYYVSSNGICIVHGSPYMKDNLDRKIHVEHDPATVKFIPYKECSFYRKSFSSVVSLLQKITPYLNQKLTLSKQCYQVLGVDIIFDNQKHPYVIEINAWPNMVSYEQTSRSLKTEFFQNFISELVIPKINQVKSKNTYFKKLKGVSRT